MNERIVIFGGGAIGGAIAASLARASIDAAIVDPWFQNVETMRRSGLRCTRPDVDFTVPVRAYHIDELPSLGQIDVLIVAMKSYDTEWVVRYAAPQLSDDAIVVSAQNGINEDRIAAIVGRERTIGCVVAMAGGIEGPGHIVGTTPTSGSAMIVGELDGRITPRLERLCDILRALGNSATTNDIWGALWSKLVLNVMTNPLGGMTGWSTPELWADPRAVSIMVHLGGEAVLAGEASGVQVHDNTPPGAPAPIRMEQIKQAHLGNRHALSTVTAAFAATAGGRVGAAVGRVSLLQDILKGRRTEVDYLNGYIVRESSRFGRAALANSAAISVLREVETGRRRPEPKNLDRVAALLEGRVAASTAS